MVFAAPAQDGARRVPQRCSRQTFTCHWGGVQPGGL